MITKLFIKVRNDFNKFDDNKKICVTLPQDTI